MFGHAHQSDATAWLNLHKTQSPAVHREHGNRVAPGVDREQPFLVAGQYQAPLVSQSTAGSAAAGRHGAGSHESPVRESIEDEHPVSVGCIRHSVDGTRKPKSQTLEILGLLGDDCGPGADNEGRGGQAGQKMNEPILHGSAPFVRGGDSCGCRCRGRRHDMRPGLCA